MQETLKKKLEGFWSDIDAMRTRGEGWKAVAAWLAEQGLSCRPSALRAYYSMRNPRRKVYAPSIAALAAFLPHMYGYTVEQAVQRCGKELLEMHGNGCTWESMAMALRLQGVMATSRRIAVVMLRMLAWKQPEMSVEGLMLPAAILRECSKEAAARAPCGLAACLPLIARLRGMGIAWKDITELLIAAGLKTEESRLRKAASLHGIRRGKGMDNKVVIACAGKVLQWMRQTGVKLPLGKPKQICMSMSGAIATLRRGKVSWQDISRIFVLCGIHVSAGNLRANFG